MSIELALQLVIAFLGAYAFAFWFALVIWTYRDISSRTHDWLLRILATALVFVFNLPGLLLYVILRPRETLAEAYERSLEEETLLQEIEDYDHCSTCRHRIEPEFLICPNCHSKLKRPCQQCNRALQLPWKVCPYCGAV